MVKFLIPFIVALSFLGINIANAALPDHHEDRRIIVINHSSKRIVGLFASPIDQNDWKFNMLSTLGDSCHCIRVNDKIIADINDSSGYCRYDIMAILADGRKAFLMDANVCEMETWTITD